MGCCCWARGLCRWLGGERDEDPLLAGFGSEAGGGGGVTIDVLPKLLRAFRRLPSVGWAFNDTNSLVKLSTAIVQSPPL